MNPTRGALWLALILTSACQAAPRNCVLISIDTLRADHMSCYGYDLPTTPRLDAWAQTGVRFASVTSSASWTVPAHLTMFTGLEPAVHDCIGYPSPGRLRDEYVTLAEYFKSIGIRTGAFTGGGFVSGRHGLIQGFDHFTTRGPRFEENLNDVWRWLNRRPGQPFFLFLHGYNVHHPYAPPPPYNRRYVGDYDGCYDVDDFRPHNPMPGPVDLAYMISQYDGEITLVDDLLSNFLERLRISGLLDGTVVVITSDHGEEFAEHGRCDHGHSLYDELVRVPLIIFGPSIRPRVVEHHVGLIDLLPTLLELFEIEPRAPMQGRNLVPLIADKQGQAVNRPIYSYTAYSDYPYRLSSVRTNRWKLIAYELAGMQSVDLASARRNDENAFRLLDRAEDFVELYDLRADVTEQVNVAHEHQDVVRALAEKLSARTLESKRLSGGRSAPPAGPPDEDYLRVLKALGYLK